MRSRFFAALTALFVFGLLIAPRAAQATTSFFVLDFNDGTTTPDYSFEYNYTGLTPTAADMISVIAAQAINPSFSDTYTDYSFGRFYNSFTYGAKTASTTADFSSYWGFWTSTDGINWTVASVGASDDVLSNGSWAAFSYGPNGGAAPVTPSSFSAIVSSAAAPEPASLALLLTGAWGFTALVRRRRVSDE